MQYKTQLGDCPISTVAVDSWGKACEQARSLSKAYTYRVRIHVFSGNGQFNHYKEVAPFYYEKGKRFSS